MNVGDVVRLRGQTWTTMTVTAIEDAADAKGVRALQAAWVNRNGGLESIHADERCFESTTPEQA